MLLLVVGAWAGVLVLALHVSTIIIDTLDAIVQLADLAP
jgi:hypothetical protein